MEQFEKLGICEHVLKVVKAKKFEKPSEIQEKTIPLILDGKDVVAGSKTGSGKTLAFGAGIIQNVEPKNGVQGLILTPTRELAEQVASQMQEFSYYKKLEVVPVYGGVSIENQIKKVSHANIVVATPGRLLDHMNRNSIDLSNVSFLVLDEADRMWDMGFKDDVAKIVTKCPKDRQTLLFSATISGELASFSEKYMKAPVEISVEHYVDASKLHQVYYDARDNEKFSLLVHLLKNEQSKNPENQNLVMVFCNTRRNADFVAKNLKLNAVDAHVIHGGMDQSKRMRVLKGFDNGTVNVLVCTDVAARGLDIKGVSHIYNYDMAADAKDYVHRIGRTARAGESGVAINIITSRDYDNFANVQKHNPELRIEREMTPKFERIFVKFDEDKRSFGGRGNGRTSSPSRGRQSSGRSFGRSSGSRDSSPRRSPRSDGRKPSGNFRRSSSSRDSNPRRSSGEGPRRTQGSFRREQRGERNKRTNNPSSNRSSNFKRD
nr:DEAD/DEAH box helicase [archaeon]